MPSQLPPQSTQRLVWAGRCAAQPSLRSQQCDRCRACCWLRVERMCVYSALRLCDGKPFTRIRLCCVCARARGWLIENARTQTADIVPAAGVSLSGGLTVAQRFGAGALATINPTVVVVCPYGCVLLIYTINIGLLPRQLPSQPAPRGRAGRGGLWCSRLCAASSVLRAEHAAGCMWGQCVCTANLGVDMSPTRRRLCVLRVCALLSE